MYLTKLLFINYINNVNLNSNYNCMVIITPLPLIRQV